MSEGIRQAGAQGLSSLDLGYVPHCVLAAYLVMLLGLGYVGYRRSVGSEDDYYLAGRGQGVIVTTLTIMATMFSSAAMLGIPGWIYRDGVGATLFALHLPLGGAVIYVFGSRIRRLGRARGYLTPADMVADYYGGSACLRILTALVGFLYVLPYVIMQIKAGGYLAQRMFPDAGSLELFGRSYDMFAVGTTVLSLVTMLYVLIGGMRSVAWTDVIQGLLLLSGMILAGVATVFAMGGFNSFWAQVAEQPIEALSLPGPEGKWATSRLLTVCIFTSIASMIHPGQWMRYYSARSSGVLRTSALIFSILLPLCFLLGVFIVGLGGRVLYPPGPDSPIGKIDEVVIVMIQQQVPLLLGGMGVFAVALTFVAIMAASMSTADSNLHAMSAVVTRDIYDRFISPSSSQRQRTWVGRAVIVITTLLALALVHAGGGGEFQPLELIGQLMLVAIAFSCQLLPVTLDMLFFQRGTRAGAIAGMLAGLSVVFLFTPFPWMVTGQAAAPLEAILERLRGLLDVGFLGFAVNVIVMASVSRFTKKLDPRSVEEFVRTSRAPAA